MVSGVALCVTIVMRTINNLIVSSSHQLILTCNLAPTPPGNLICLLSNTTHNEVTLTSLQRFQEAGDANLTGQGDVTLSMPALCRLQDQARREIPQDYYSSAQPLLGAGWSAMYTLII